MLLLILLVVLGCVAYIGIGRWIERRAPDCLRYERLTRYLSNVAHKFFFFLIGSFRFWWDLPFISQTNMHEKKNITALNQVDRNRPRSKVVVDVRFHKT